MRVEALRDLVDGFEPRDGDDPAVLDTAELAFGPPILRPPSLRDFYAFEGHVRTMWERRGGEVPETWYRLPIFYFSNVSEIRGPDDPIRAPANSRELDYELEVHHHDGRRRGDDRNDRREHPRRRHCWLNRPVRFTPAELEPQPGAPLCPTSWGRGWRCCSLASTRDCGPPPTQTYFNHPGNRFYPVLFASGLHRH